MRKTERNQLKEYKKTVAKLKRENRRLKAELTRSGALNTKVIHGNDDTARKFAGKCRAAALINEKSYFGYLKKRFLTASFYSVWMRLLSYFRRFRLISTTVKIISWGLTIIGTSAFFLVVSASILILIPFISFTFALFIASTAVRRRRLFSALKKRLSGGSVYVFFPSADHQFGRGTFFEKTVNIISNSTNGTNFIIIVSPYLISSRSILGDRAPYYHVLRAENDKIYMIRRSSFFSFRKNVLSKISESVIYVY